MEKIGTAALASPSITVETPARGTDQQPTQRRPQSLLRIGSNAPPSPETGGIQIQDAPELEPLKGSVPDLVYLFRMLQDVGTRGSMLRAAADADSMDRQLDIQQKKFLEKQKAEAAQRAEIEKKQEIQRIFKWIMSAVSILVSVVVGLGSFGTGAAAVALAFVGVLSAGLDLSNNICHLFKDATMLDENGNKKQLDLSLGGLVDQIMAAMVRADIILVEGINDTHPPKGLVKEPLTQKQYDTAKTAASITLNVAFIVATIAGGIFAAGKKVADGAMGTINAAIKAPDAGQETLAVASAVAERLRPLVETNLRLAGTAGTGVVALGGIGSGVLSGVLTGDRNDLMDASIARHDLSLNQEIINNTMAFHTKMANIIATLVTEYYDQLLRIPPRVG